ncbi:hypothetical protein AT6N2_C0964 [Agrobacterium tumefaciens]|nr:hypothetical protein AT6N2_C0964 [Agrobacterium tumefaciens]
MAEEMGSSHPLAASFQSEKHRSSGDITLRYPQSKTPATMLRASFMEFLFA